MRFATAVTPPSGLWLLVAASGSPHRASAALVLEEAPVVSILDAGLGALDVDEFVPLPEDVEDMDIDVFGPLDEDMDLSKDFFDSAEDQSGFLEDFEVEESLQATQVSRALMGDVYKPLMCNAEAGILNDDTCLSTATTLTSLVAARSPNSTAPLVIPCGQCVAVDVTDGSTLTIPHGIDIHGRLHFPPTSNLVLNTTSIFVQGQLDITEPVPGNFVTVNLYGIQEQYLYPQMACSGGHDPACAARKKLGTKPIVIAGGKLNIRTRKASCPTWTLLVEHVSDAELKVDPAFAACVKPGEGLLITTHSSSWSGDQKKTIVAVDPVTGIIHIDTPSATLPSLNGPGEPEMAVEIASLSRAVKFVGQRDNPSSQIGAHLIVYHTPDVPQLLAGVHFENFGQGGILGRYPVHFHMSGNSPSEVSGNLVTASNQRCYVIHTTNQVTVSNNVAYDTKGHCYITEAGNEVHNVFANNLGARTKLLGHSNGQSDSPGGPHLGSTFWIRDMNNEFYGNVAAGSQSIGWWFEFPGKYGNNMKSTKPISSFRDNVAHSAGNNCMTTYKLGWFPSTPAVFDNIKIFKCTGESGFKAHHTGLLIIKNSFFADNSKSVRYGVLNNGITVKDSKMIGHSKDRAYRQKAKCLSSTGIYASYNVWPSASKQRAIFLDNVTMDRWVCNSRMIRPYSDSRRPQGYKEGMGDPMQLSLNITNSAVSSKPYFNCGGDQNTHTEDFGGGLGPNGNESPGFLIKNVASMKAFLPPDSCTTLTHGGSCDAHCSGVCLRYFDIISNIAGATTLVLERGDVSYSFPLGTYSKFRMVLPSGSYHGTFYDASGNQVIGSSSPTILSYRRPRCDDYATASDFSFPTRAPTPSPTVAPSESAAPSRGIDPINLAYKKPASHKCNFSSYAASRAVDGRTGPCCSRRLPTHTCKTSNAWWKVDLQGLKEIHSVDIWNRLDCCPSRLSNFYVIFKDENNVEVKRMYHSGAWGIFGNMNPGRRVFARYVLIQLTSGKEALSLTEVKVMGWNPITPSLTGAPSSTALITSAPTATASVSPSVAKTSPPTATASVTPSVVTAPVATPPPTETPTKNPTQAPTNNPTASPTNNPTSSPTNNPTTSPTDPPANATVATVTSPPITSSPTYAPTRGSVAVNLSHKKPATHKCKYGTYSPARAVDGIVNRKRRYTTHTCKIWNAWWQVDLQGMKEIDRVSIWNRGDCCQFRLSNFYLIFLDDQGQEVKRIYNKGGNGWAKTFYPGKGVYARYFKVQLTSKEPLSMTEVKVYGWAL
mmetsp:Transcript_63131/g.186552  ORF Transcript_63131/g.186552 Transcript_63131/m.186552 type:complete len:1275 (-) Transcript_63131:327-4151(-)|eukprot:CAMPEP_0113532616 /NCGR_PEP_ID=MMETSP0015_2-20120614/4159_1 /TAXON_ID=2838 /ORGANISM="Odontella" /LENGTH=1274 /DNA_ID=CAMNT_0000431599 /DNA_START=334 /DNA_END=4158 /DNA_ORIENTATION=+ /assembly_acc=CAM_ASM_000160